MSFYASLSVWKLHEYASVAQMDFIHGFAKSPLDILLALFQTLH